jgi:hypothetical protein
MQEKTLFDVKFTNSPVILIAHGVNVNKTFGKNVIKTIVSHLHETQNAMCNFHTVTRPSIKFDGLLTE